MPVRITSRVASGPLWISLTSGAQLRLAPGQTSEERPDVDVQNNPSVASLVSRGLIEVTPVSSARRARAAGNKEEVGEVSPAAAKPGEAGDRA